MKFTHAVLLTFDKKKDWSKGKVSHSILAAEIQTLVGVSIEFWDLDQFVKAFLPQPELEIGKGLKPGATPKAEDTATA